MATTSGTGRKPSARTTSASSGGSGDDERIAALTEIIGELVRGQARLEERYEGMAETVSVSAGLSEIGVGLSTLAAELEPLRALVPPTLATAPSKNVVSAMQTIRDALTAPSWRGIENLAIPVRSVPAIGQPAPDPVNEDAEDAPVITAYVFQQSPEEAER